MVSGAVCVPTYMPLPADIREQHLGAGSLLPLSFRESSSGDWACPARAAPNSAISSLCGLTLGLRSRGREVTSCLRLHTALPERRSSVLSTHCGWEFRIQHPDGTSIGARTPGCALLGTRACACTHTTLFVCRELPRCCFVS